MRQLLVRVESPSWFTASSTPSTHLWHALNDPGHVHLKRDLASLNHVLRQCTQHHLLRQGQQLRAELRKAVANLLVQVRELLVAAGGDPRPGGGAWGSTGSSCSIEWLVVKVKGEVGVGVGQVQELTSYCPTRFPTGNASNTPCRELQLCLYYWWCHTSAS